MTLEHYAYLGEIVAALAVIASLVYVARELRQNTNQTRISVAGSQVAADDVLVEIEETDHG